MPVCLTSRRVIIGALALVLIVILELGSLVIVKNVYAESKCVVLLCPTPTPSPTPFPTPTPPQTIGPTPTPGSAPTASSTPVPTATATTNTSPTATSASPTATSTGGTQTPVPSQTSIPATKSENAGDQTPNQLGGGGFSQVMVIVAVVFLGLLLCLGIGLFFLRPMLLPSIDVKSRSREFGSWSLTGIPQVFAKGTPKKKRRY